MRGTGVHLLTNPVRHYAWGDQDFIPDLTGDTPDGRPWAELWIGAHPDDSSTLADGTSLAELIERQPDRVLGARVRARFGDRLPYLGKVLSAAGPLSIQVHPDPEQAARGYAAEEAAGVERSAPHRRYRDPYAKPEMILALGAFEALCGIRPVARTLEVLDALAVEHPRWPGLTDRLRVSPDASGVRSFLETVLTGPAWVGGLSEAVAGAAAALDTPTGRTLADLGERYPGDPGVLVALLLNRVSLRDGEAMFLGAGVLHAYLSGHGIEVMGASDNVLRAGLTGKHVDAAELLALAALAPGPPDLVAGQDEGGVRSFGPDTPEFAVHVVRADGDPMNLPGEGPRIVLALDGEMSMAPDAGAATVLRRGRSAMVEAAAGPVTVSGEGTAVVAGVPAPMPDHGFEPLPERGADVSSSLIDRLGGDQAD